MNPRRLLFVGQNSHLSSQYIEDLQGDKLEIRDSKLVMGLKGFGEFSQSRKSDAGTPLFAGFSTESGCDKSRLSTE
jgi:hypothetical protein